MIDEPIEVVEYDPSWPVLFEQEKTRIFSGLEVKDLVIEHFGSTSISGMKAKPIIDLLIGYQPSVDVELFVRGIMELGYEHLGEAGVPGRIAFRRRETRSFNIAAFVYNSEAFRKNIAIREYLRNTPEACREYERMKEEAVRLGIKTLIHYSEHKFDFVRELEEKAKRFIEGKCP